MNKLEQDIYDLAMYKIACWDVGMEKDAIAFAPMSSPAANSRFLNGPGKPGFFQRMGQGFKNLGNKVRGFFGGGSNTSIPKKQINTPQAEMANRYGDIPRLHSKFPSNNEFREFSISNYNDQVDKLKRMPKEKFKQQWDRDPDKMLVSSDTWYGRQPVDPRLDSRMNNEMNTRINNDLNDSLKSRQWYLDSLNFLNNSAAEIARSKGMPYTPMQPNRELFYTPQSF